MGPAARLRAGRPPLDAPDAIAHAAPLDALNIIIPAVQGLHESLLITGPALPHTKTPCFLLLPLAVLVQGYLAHKKTPPPRALQ